MTRRKIAPMLTLLLLFSLDAHAKKDKDEVKGVQLTGIEAFDSVFSRVAEIDLRLVSAEQLLTQGKKDLNSALDLKRGTPFSEAITELKSRANGKLTLAMKGNLPKLEATDAVPTNVQNAIDAVNSLTDGIIGTVDNLVGIPDEAQKLIKQSKKFPDRLKDEITTDPISAIFKAPKVLKTLKGNTEITVGLPSRSTKVVGRMNDMVSVVRTEFPVKADKEESTPEKGQPGSDRATPPARSR